MTTDSNNVKPNEFSLTGRMRKALAASGDATLLGDINADIEKKQWAKIDELKAEIEALKKEAENSLTETWVEARLLNHMAPIKVEMEWEKWLSRAASAGVGALIAAAMLFYIQHR